MENILIKTHKTQKCIECLTSVKNSAYWWCGEKAVCYCSPSLTELHAGEAKLRGS